MQPSIGKQSVPAPSPESQTPLSATDPLASTFGTRPTPVARPEEVETSSSTRPTHEFTKAGERRGRPARLSISTASPNQPLPSPSASTSRLPPLPSGSAGLATRSTAGNSDSSWQKKRKWSSEERSAHSQVEKKRREHLNGQLLTLARNLPTLADKKRLSKSIIAQGAIDHVAQERQLVLGALPTLRALIVQRDALIQEVAEWRTRYASSSRQIVAVDTEPAEKLYRVERYVFASFPGGFTGKDDKDDAGAEPDAEQDPEQEEEQEMGEDLHRTRSLKMQETIITGSTSASSSTSASIPPPSGMQYSTIKREHLSPAQQMSGLLSQQVPLPSVSPSISSGQQHTLTPQSSSFPQVHHHYHHSQQHQHPQDLQHAEVLEITSLPGQPPNVLYSPVFSQHPNLSQAEAYLQASPMQSHPQGLAMVDPRFPTSVIPGFVPHHEPTQPLFSHPGGGLYPQLAEDAQKYHQSPYHFSHEGVPLPDAPGHYAEHSMPLPYAIPYSAGDLASPSSAIAPLGASHDPQSMEAGQQPYPYAHWIPPPP